MHKICLNLQHLYMFRVGNPTVDLCICFSAHVPRTIEGGLLWLYDHQFYARNFSEENKHNPNRSIHFLFFCLFIMFLERKLY